MKPLSPRDKLVVWGLAVVALLVVFYFYVYTPKTREISVVSQQLKAATADLARLQAQAARKEELDRRVQQIQHDLQDIEAKLPSAREIPVLLVRLESLASQVSANLILIKPGPLQNPQQPVGQPPQPSRPGAPPAPTATISYQTFSLELSVEGPFDVISSFVHGIETFPRFISMTDLRLSPATRVGQMSSERPTLNLGLQATTYVLPESGGSR
jgi:Tfp pilus assembly protein PilO